MVLMTIEETRAWKVVKINNDYIIVPTQPLFCPICSHRILIHDFRAYYSAQKFYHCDIHAKCSYCGLYLTFGIPISADEYARLRSSRLHGKVITHEILNIIEEKELQETIREKLRTWGYW